MRKIFILNVFIIFFGCSTKEKKESIQNEKADSINTSGIDELDKTNYSKLQPILLKQNLKSSEGKPPNESNPEIKHWGPKDSVNRAIRSYLQIIDHDKSGADSLSEVYIKFQPFLNNWNKQGFLIYALRNNDASLISLIWSDLQKEGYDLNDGAIKWHLRPDNRQFTFRFSSMCDSMTMKWVIDNVDWKLKSRRDSIYHLYKAARDSNHELLQYYLDNGWKGLIDDRFADYGSGDECDVPTNSWTPLEISLSISDTLSARILLNSGAKLDSTALIYWADSTGIDFALKELSKRGQLNSRLIQQSLLFAARWGYVSKARNSLSRGADPNLPDENGETAIFYTLKHRQCGDPTTKKRAILKELIDAGANVNHQNKNGETALMLSTLPACGDGCAYRLGFTKLLLENGADTFIKNKDGLNTWDYIDNCYNETMVSYFANLPQVPNANKVFYDSILRNRKWNYHGYIL